MDPYTSHCSFVGPSSLARLLRGTHAMNVVFEAAPSYASYCVIRLYWLMMGFRSLSDWDFLDN